MSLAKTSVTIGLTTLLSGLAGTALADANPFAMQTLSQGYMVAEEGSKSAEGKCGEGKCGGKKAAEKTEEGKCGAAKSSDKSAEGQCGASKEEGKSKEGSGGASQ